MAIIEEIVEGEEDHLARVERIKKDGNEKFGNGDYDEAAEKYKEAIDACPETSKTVKSTLFSNLSAAFIKQAKWQEAIDAASKAIEIGSSNEKALERRAFAYSNIPEQLESAIEDYKELKNVCEKRTKEFDRKIEEITKMIGERNEKLKEDVIGKLKGFGDFCLRPFGLSTDSFELVPNGQGGYSVQMKNGNKPEEGDQSER